MSEWRADKAWSDRFLPQIKGICGSHLVGEAPVEEDAEHNTDLIVLRMDAVRIACRVRRYQYLAKYPNEFTIRQGRPSGVKTELTKVVEGWGDFMLYGFSDAEERALARWVLIDLSVFRGWFVRRLARLAARQLPGSEQSNGDGVTFRAFDLASDFSDEEQARLIVAASWMGAPGGA